ncbi:MAG: hypothetical protein IPK26_00070 [Planctomycetes bacterium]|nr:hypothetical protein [Planctomycetota bacterium]
MNCFLTLRRVLVFALAAGLAVAHGGQYRGPWGGPSVPPGVPGPGGPTTGGPGSPAPGPTTGGGGGFDDATSWQVWWEFNKDSFLRLREAVMDEPVSGSDEFYLGPTKVAVARDAMFPSEKERRDRIVPALAELLRREDHRDIVTATLVSLARIGLDAPGVVLEDVFARYLPRDEQEVRETAVLAFGIAGRASGLPFLQALLRDDKRGRQLVDQAEVGERTRAFAAWSLGLLARRSTDAGVKQQVHDLLAPVLADDELKSRDLRVAAISAMGLLRPEPSRAADKRLQWQAVDELLAFYQQDLGKGMQLVQAHVPTALARLLGRGREAAHQRVKKLLIGELSAKERRNPTIYMSAALALGQMSLPQEDEAEDAAVSQALLRAFRELHDRQARNFALIALGRIGGEQNRRDLLAMWPTAHKLNDRPWLAMALGLIAWSKRSEGTIDDDIGRLLREEILDQENEEALSAFAVGLGLSGFEPGYDDLMQQLKKNEKRERVAGYLCVAVALLGNREAAPELSAIMGRSLRRPFLLQQSAIALGRLGDKAAVPQLQEMLTKSESVASLASIAGGIGEIGDRRTITPLLDMLKDDELGKLARAFVAASLGRIGDKDKLPWNVPYSLDVNYRADVDTLVNGMNGILDIL